jgi:sialidase-1
MISCKATGLVYRNPKPHLRAVHAWHPSIVSLSSRELACSFDLGQAAESLDYRTYIVHSTDGGYSWSPPQPIIDDPQSRPTTHTLRISAVDDGTLVAIGGRFYRDNPEEGLTNRANMGFVPMDVMLSRSRDRGQSWDSPLTLQPPLIGPAFEVCHAIVERHDGSWLWPTQTWSGWDGEAPNGMRAIALVSYDRGSTWPQYLDVMHASDLIHFEQSLVELHDGRLLAVTWRYDPRTQRTHPTPYAISSDGRTFSQPSETGLRAQTAKLLVLRDGRVLCIYRPDGRDGLWACLARITGDRWETLHNTMIWGRAPIGPAAGTTSEMLASLKFGYPQITQLAGGNVLIVFWCLEQEVQNIRWIRVDVGDSERQSVTEAM